MPFSALSQIQLLAHLCVVLFALTALIAKSLELSAYAIVVGRTFFAALALGLVLSLRPLRFGLSSLKSPNKKQLPLLFLSALVLCVHWYAFFQSVNLGGASVALLTFACFPLFLMSLQLMLGVTLFKQDWWVAIGIILGITIMVPTPIAGPSALAWMWGFFSSALFAILTLFNQRLRFFYSSSVIAFGQNFLACFLIVIVVRDISFVWALAPNQWVLLIVCGVICTALAHTLLIYCLGIIPAVQASFIVNLESVYGLIMAVLFLKEPLTLKVLMGALLVFFSVLYHVLTHSEVNRQAKSQLAG